MPSARRAHLQAEFYRHNTLWTGAQVLRNLISNALKYNRPEGTVTVRTTALPGRVIIECADTGIGIAPALQSRLFQPFDRLGAERSTIECVNA